jgi:hypothetical protein
MTANRPGSALRFHQVRLSDRSAWVGATFAALFNALGMLVQIAIMRDVPGISTRPAVLSALAALILFIGLLARRNSPSVKWAYLAFSFTTVSVITVLVLSNLNFATLERHWTPFQANKLGCLVAAMVAPGFWVGLLSILAYCLSAVFQLQFFFPPEVKAAAETEPWPTIAFGLAGVLALIYRFRRAQVETDLARIQAQNQAIRRLAHIFLNIRDRMNTPLQVIELSSVLLRDSAEPSEALLDRIDRSVHHLKEINSLLVQHEKEIEWQAKNPASPG